jgi:hypothetical protein
MAIWINRGDFYSSHVAETEKRFFCFEHKGQAMLEVLLHGALELIKQRDVRAP